MGRANARAVYALWPELDHGPFRLLVGMALVALDPPGGKAGRKPCLYYDGEDGLMLLTGRRRSVTYDMLQTLIAKGAIVVEGNGRLGSKAVYRVVIDAGAVSAKPHARSASRARNFTTRQRPRNPDPPDRPQRPQDPDPQASGLRGHAASATPGPLGGTKEDGEECVASSVEVVRYTRANAASNPGLTHDQAYKILTKRLGLDRVLDMAAEHEPACGCDDVLVCLAGHLPPLRVIHGDRS